MKPAKVNPDLCRGFKSTPRLFRSTADHRILYALALGFSADPLDSKELDFTYEGSENFRTVPTYPVLAGDFTLVIDMLERCPGMPQFHPGKLLHVEFKLDLFRPVPDGETLVFKGELMDVVDKKSGALVIIKFSLYDRDNQVLNDQYLTFFIRDLGGFGSKSTSNPALPQPKRPADHTTIQPLLPSQGLLYRLCGDKNPLHVSKEIAQVAGFEKPLLHGLCFYGIAAKAVLKEVCNYDVSRIQSIYVRMQLGTLLVSRFCRGNTHY